MTLWSFVTSLILVALVLGFIGNGWKDGFIRTLGRAVGAVVGFLIAKSLYLTVGSVIMIIIPTGWSKFIAFIVILVLVNQLIGYAFHLIEGVFNILAIIPFLKSVNKILGAILGIFEAVIALGAAIWIVTQFNLIPALAGLLVQSWVATQLMASFMRLISVFPHALAV